jgi:hypothetical protein
LGLFNFAQRQSLKTSVLLSSNITKACVERNFSHFKHAHFTSISRKQLRFSSLEDTISPDKPGAI